MVASRRHQATFAIRGSFNEIFADIPEPIRNAIRSKDWTYPKAAYWVQGDGDSPSWTGLSFIPAYYPDGEFLNKRSLYRAPWLLKVSRQTAWFIEAF